MKIEFVPNCPTVKIHIKFTNYIYLLTQGNSLSLSLQCQQLPPPVLNIGRYSGIANLDRTFPSIHTCMDMAGYDWRQQEHRQQRPTTQ